MRAARAMLAALALTLAGTPPAPALLPEERLADPAGEARARALSAQLRCLVCQNQSIDDSDAPFASDMRKLIRQQIAEGRGDGEIIAFLRQRYGDYVLLDPPFGAATALLWIAPFGFLALGVAGLAAARRRRTRRGARPGAAD